MSNPNPKLRYDVFISFFRHEDTDHFTSDLYDALRKAQIDVFDVDRKLGREDQILLQAIEASRISIIVFSNNYASSRLCMQELEKIMECRRAMRQMVVPVFYGVDPSEVRQQKGMFGKAFEDLTNKVSLKKDVVLSYRTALREAGKILGLLRDESSNDSALVTDIVHHVMEYLKLEDWGVKKHTVGLQSRVQDVIQLLDYRNSDDVRLLGICGMGGIGKTTIARAICSQICYYFDVQKFLSDICETSERSGLVSVQQELLSVYYRTAKIKTQNIELGTAILRKRLCHHKVFLVLDDVIALEQLDALCGSREWFGPGSRIIITTRDESLLNTFGVDHVYKVKIMNEIESIELFSWRAFKQATPTAGYVELSMHAVTCSRGLPLALEVLGSFFFGKHIEQWQVGVLRLRNQPTLKVQDVLKLSFNGLSDTEKHLFLDITSFFIGMDRNEVIQTLNRAGYFAENGISVLEDKSFVTVDENNKLGAHVLIQEMGREIIRQESQSSPELEPRIFDVFLSFRGEDTRASFTSHLHAALQNAGIYVFKDDDEIQRGDQISLSLLQAIGRSRISVIILSRNYANSRWCLQELENILESIITGLVVVPVFYGVDPSEVRNQRGMFGQAFEGLVTEILVKEDTVQSWRNSLQQKWVLVAIN